MFYGGPVMFVVTLFHFNLKVRKCDIGLPAVLLGVSVAVNITVCFRYNIQSLTAAFKESMYTSKAYFPHDIALW